MTETTKYIGIPPIKKENHDFNRKRHRVKMG